MGETVTGCNSYITYLNFSISFGIGEVDPPLYDPPPIIMTRNPDTHLCLVLIKGGGEVTDQPPLSWVVQGFGLLADGGGSSPTEA